MYFGILRQTPRYCVLTPATSYYQNFHAAYYSKFRSLTPLHSPQLTL